MMVLIISPFHATFFFPFEDKYTNNWPLIIGYEISLVSILYLIRECESSLLSKLCLTEKCNQCKSLRASDL